MTTTTAPTDAGTLPAATTAAAARRPFAPGLAALARLCRAAAAMDAARAYAATCPGSPDDRAAAVDLLALARREAREARAAANALATGAR